MANPSMGSSPGTTQGVQRLEKNVLSVPNGIALAAAAMAPVIAGVLNAPAAGPVAGAALPLSFLLAFIACLMVGNSIVQFARVCPQQDRSIHSMAYPLWAVAQPGQTFPYNLVPYIVIAWIVLGIITFVYFRVKAPEKLAALGSFLAEDNLSEDRLMLEDATHSAHQAEAD